MATQTVAAAGGNWSSTATWVSGVVPAAGDAVVLALTSGSLTIDANTNVVASFVEQTGYIGTVTLNAAVTLSIGGATAAIFTLIAGSTWVNGSATTSVVQFTNTTTGGTITTTGLVLPMVTFNGVGGGWTTQDSLNTTSTSTVTLTNGTLNTNSTTCSWGAFVGTSGVANTLNMSNSAITITSVSVATSWNVGTTTTLVTTGSTLTINVIANGSVGFGAYTYATVTVQSAGAVNLGSAAATFANLTLAQIGAVKTVTFRFLGTLTVTGTLTINGNSVVNRIFVFGATAGTQATFALGTTGTVTVANANFMDIAITGTHTPVTGTSLGDCLGNSGITFDAPTTQTWSGNTAGNWSTTANWTSRVPLPQDNVLIPGLVSSTITNDMPQMGANIDFTGSTGGIWNGGAVAMFFGNLTLAAGMQVLFGTVAITAAGRGSQTIRSAGVPFGNAGGTTLTIQSPGGSYTQLDALQVGASNSAMSIVVGTFSTANFALTIAGSLTVAAGVTFTAGTSVITLNSTSVGYTTIVNVSATATVSCASATFVVGSAMTITRTFAGGSHTYGALTYTLSGSTGALAITGSNTFGTINFSDASNARTLVLQASTTTTITSAFNVNGTPGKLMSLASSIPGTAYTLVAAV